MRGDAMQVKCPQPLNHRIKGFSSKNKINKQKECAIGKDSNAATYKGSKALRLRLNL